MQKPGPCPTAHFLSLCCESSLPLVSAHGPESGRLQKQAGWGQGLLEPDMFYGSAQTVNGLCDIAAPAPAAERSSIRGRLPNSPPPHRSSVLRGNAARRLVISWPGAREWLASSTPARLSKDMETLARKWPGVHACAHTCVGVCSFMPVHPNVYPWICVSMRTCLWVSCTSL